MTRARHCLHLSEPSRKVDVERLDEEVIEVDGGGNDGVKDAGEIACRVFLSFEGFLLRVLCRLIRITLSKVLPTNDELLGK